MLGNWPPTPTPLLMEQCELNRAGDQEPGRPASWASVTSLLDEEAGVRCQGEGSLPLTLRDSNRPNCP